MTAIQQRHEIMDNTTSYFDPQRTISRSASDGDLVDMAKAGNQEAFELLVERYRTPLYQFISRYFGDYDQRCDVMQQVLIQLYISLPDLQTNRSLQAGCSASRAIAAWTNCDTGTCRALPKWRGKGTRMKHYSL